MEHFYMYSWPLNLGLSAWLQTSNNLWERERDKKKYEIIMDQSNSNLQTCTN